MGPMLDLDADWIEVPGLISQPEVDAIVSAAGDWLDGLVYEGEHREELRTGDKPNGGTRRLAVADQRIEAVAEITRLPSLLDAVARLGSDGDPPLPGADPSALYKINDVAFRSPGPGFGGQRLHADAVARLTAAELAAPPDVVTAIIALVDFTADNGATRAVPGSHRRGDLQRQAADLDAHPKERVLIGAAGTAFVFSGHLLHGGGVNGSSRPRPALQICWRR